MKHTTATEWLGIWDAGSYTSQGLLFMIEGSEMSSYNPGSGVVGNRRLWSTRRLPNPTPPPP